MTPIASARVMIPIVALGLLAHPARSQDDAPAEMPQVRLLKANKVPEARLGQVVEMVARRGKAADLGYLFDRALRPDGFPATVRLGALRALAEAAQTRKARPDGDLARLKAFFDDPALRSAAIRLAGLWKVEALNPTLLTLVKSPADRPSALEALAEIGGDANKRAIDALATSGPPDARADAVAALARLDLAAAVDRAASVIAGSTPGQDLAPMLAPILNGKDGADTLAAAVARAKLAADPAKLALRAVFALGRSDAALVDALTRAAGISPEVKAPDKPEMDRLLAEVGSSGDAARGERVFRRADLNCTKCHAVAGAGGGVGPDLSVIGSSSPVDYLVYSIMVPDQSIKEEFVTKVVQTADGRVFQGIVADKDDRRIVLREATGETRVIPADEVEDTKDGGSLMPKGLVNFMTRAEFVDLLKFLSELGKPGLYALHPGMSPSIQRWRVFKGAPDLKASTAPDADVFSSGVHASDPARWLPYYAFVPGDLPLDDLSGLAGVPVVYLRGEVSLTAGGPIAFRLNDPAGVAAWVDGRAAQPAASIAGDLGPGVHTLTLRVDTKARGGRPLQVLVTKPEGSTAEFTVVGGR